MKTKIVLPLLLLLLCFIACKDDDLGIEPDKEVIEESTEEPDDDAVDPTVVLAEQRAENTTVLTDGSSKVWKIDTAILNNGSGAIDVSENFNILDDEFIFRNGTTTGKTEFEGTLEWRQNNVIAFEATTAEDAKLDFYVSPETLTYDFDTDSSSSLTSSDAAFSFTINESNELVGTITYTEDASLDVTLTPKAAADYQQVPSTALSFSEAFTFQSNSVDSGAVGMVGSLANNSFFVALRDANPAGNFNEERVLRFDLSDNSVKESYYDNPDFVSKQLIPHNGQLLVVGGQRINSYDLDLNNTPTSYQDYRFSLGLDYLGLSRFGTATVDGDVYLYGGDLDNPAVEIYNYNLFNEEMTIVSQLPAPRFGARGEVVDYKLYVFGGTEEFFTPPANNTIYIFDLETQSFTTETMPQAIDFTYTGKIENLIYVAGRIDSIDENNALVDREPYLGVYDTNTNTFTELETNLVSPDLETIHSMAVFDNKIYILYGQGTTIEGEIPTWSILSADL